ncbi:hypothetical protein EDD16DRAFT_1521942 [Pisolithus croceorrhizus]|nr:hypothetical protein EDD16DRAFT_1521942 [Pisolithus croceorrhizus]KAI6119276.1 hypothetical protein EV401DRAFT_1888263 [Pisolithus croceorrhizus]KAI6165113.1 hypothetical protein EDD17DRAFT_1505998 [Pisolithus thermaeus]
MTILEHHSVDELKDKENFHLAAYGQDLTQLTLEENILARWRKNAVKARVMKMNMEIDRDVLTLISSTCNIITQGWLSRYDTYSLHCTTMSSTRGKRGRKTKQKYLESLGFNPSGKSVATQLGVMEEQPLASYEIEWQLQSEVEAVYNESNASANAGDPIYETTDLAGSTLLTIAGHCPSYQHVYCPQVPMQSALGLVESISGSLHP